MEITNDDLVEGTEIIPLHLLDDSGGVIIGTNIEIIDDDGKLHVVVFVHNSH